MPTAPVIVGRQTETNVFTPHSPVEVTLTQNIPLGTVLVLLGAWQYEGTASSGVATDDAGNRWAAIGDESYGSTPPGSWPPAYTLLACEVEHPLSLGQKVYANLVAPGDPADVLIVALVAGEYEFGYITVGALLLVDNDEVTYEEIGPAASPTLDPPLVATGPGILIGGMAATFTAPAGNTVTLDPAYTDLGQVNYGQYVGSHLAYHQPFYRVVPAGSYAASVGCSPEAHRWQGAGILLLEAAPVIEPPPDPEPEPASGGGIGTSLTGGECGATGGYSTLSGGECATTGGISTLSGGEPATTGGYSSPIAGCV